MRVKDHVSKGSWLKKLCTKESVGKRGQGRRARSPRTAQTDDGSVWQWRPQSRSSNVLKWCFATGVEWKAVLNVVIKRRLQDPKCKAPTTRKAPPACAAARCVLHEGDVQQTP